MPFLRWKCFHAKPTRVYGKRTVERFMMTTLLCCDAKTVIAPAFLATADGKLCLALETVCAMDID